MSKDEVRLPVLGKTNWNQHQEVVIKPSPYDDKRFIVVIKGTGGSWYVEDFLNGRGPLAIDYGQGYTLLNADEIRQEVKKWNSTLRDIAPTAPIPASTKDVMRFTNALATARKSGKGEGKALYFLLDSLIPFVHEMYGPDQGDRFERMVRTFKSAAR
jgi:hypothetical protein